MLTFLCINISYEKRKLPDLIKPTASLVYGQSVQCQDLVQITQKLADTSDREEHPPLIKHKIEAFKHCTSRERICCSLSYTYGTLAATRLHITRIAYLFTLCMHIHIHIHIKSSHQTHEHNPLNYISTCMPTRVGVHCNGKHTHNSCPIGCRCRIVVVLLRTFVRVSLSFRRREREQSSATSQKRLERRPVITDSLLICRFFYFFLLRSYAYLYAYILFVFFCFRSPALFFFLKSLDSNLQAIDLKTIEFR